MIPAPYLLYLGHSHDPLGVKTSRGVATFRGQDCLGEFRHDDCPLTLGLPRLGMAEAALELMPEAIMGFIGLARDEETFQPKSYLAALPKRLDGRTVIVLDPMLATGGSLEYTCELLAKRGVARQIVVCVLAAPEGIERMERSGLVVEVITAAIDEKLNDKAYIVPGLGDAGDRQFGGF